ncbi:hypothetical protein AVEN_246565-1 [Araneus ventricosus]|uniref:Uncharacterized protein n=1 Tax=Araneus ventricosus TaxID=182803 RepID=A0A4Y2DE94_ARAVE|nr:hypothetical protein AVEN_246565-1 [Araneus ventricosus]
MQIVSGAELGVAKSPACPRSMSNLGRYSTDVSLLGGGTDWVSGNRPHAPLELPVIGPWDPLDPSEESGCCGLICSCLPRAVLTELSALG